VNASWSSVGSAHGRSAEQNNAGANTFTGVEKQPEGKNRSNNVCNDLSKNKPADDVDDGGKTRAKQSSKAIKKDEEDDVEVGSAS
jgi:hypothetical protein